MDYNNISLHCPKCGEQVFLTTAEMIDHPLTCVTCSTQSHLREPKTSTRTALGAFALDITRNPFKGT